MVLRSLKSFAIYSIGVTVVSIAYYAYAYLVYPPIAEKETWVSEVGEEFGEVALLGLVLIYGRTAIKLLLSKEIVFNHIFARPLISGVTGLFEAVLRILNRTHIYVGFATVTLILLHIAMSGIPMEILFFPIVLVLIIWQGVFGMFLAWKYSPSELKKVSYLVHAQLATGVMIGVFSYFGHLLID